MGWSIRKAITRTGLAALGVFVAKVINEAFVHQPEISVVDTMWTNAAMIGLIWIGAAIFVWLASKIVYSLKKPKMH